jgi:hypothetical protein
MMRILPICARKPEAAMVSDFMKSMLMGNPQVHWRTGLAACVSL